MSVHSRPSIQYQDRMELRDRKMTKDCTQPLRIGNIRALNGCAGRLIKKPYPRHRRACLPLNPITSNNTPQFNHYKRIRKRLTQVKCYKGNIHMSMSMFVVQTQTFSLSCCIMLRLCYVKKLYGRLRECHNEIT